MKVLINKNKIFVFLILTIFFDAYRFMALGNRDITLWYIGAGLLILTAIIQPQSIIAGLKENVFPLLMIVYMIINYRLLGYNGSSSLVIGLLCWIFYLCSYRRCTIWQFEKTIAFFQNGMKIMAVYGIYQIFAYYFHLPFANLWIDGIMVDGYNWGNYIKLGSLSLRRSNAIFREPSFFSQFLALSMLIYAQKILSNTLHEKEVKNCMKWLFISGIAMICSFSGTGLIMFAVGTLILLVTNQKQATWIFISKHKLFFLFILLFAVGILLIPNPIRNYMLSRMSEFDSSNIYSISGYIRMVLPYKVAIEILQHKSALFGIGIGNSLNYTMLSGYSIGGSMQPIIPRTIAEEGIIGGLLLLGFSIKLWNKKNVSLHSYKAILVGLYLMSFMHGTWSSEVFWLFLGLLHVKFEETQVETV